MKGFKVSDAKRTRRVGVACCSLDELKKKGRLKLNIDEDVTVQLEDGTIVDDEDFFQTVKEQSLLILLKDGEDAITGAELLYSALKMVNIELLQVGDLAEQFLSENLKEKMHVLTSAVEKARKMQTAKERKEKVVKSHRKDDPDWFVGIDTNADTKEKFLFQRSQDRIRGYFYKTQTAIQKSEIYKRNKVARSKLIDACTSLTNYLKQRQYFGVYFDRTAESTRLCTTFGDFQCQGLFYSPCCSYSHVINPYESREARIMFSTWNLDHRIERSREIVPGMLKAAKIAAREGYMINSESIAVFQLKKKNAITSCSWIEDKQPFYMIAQFYSTQTIKHINRSQWWRNKKR
ncbi:DNA fragmentation factor subunit beta isoform X5 [Schistocerca cancellata]|uniref:DNA fragmentation factor subunit beta isoform X5 n=1 Tax=Schistocerca cancellata TaxID=274614 RepID=UPI0021177DA2|nr:DNA fragmentation factor subunit beta isoform X5 [Schistocerca cancellata]